MSVITVCCGQCGNQVGIEFLKLLKKEKDKANYYPFKWNIFFKGNGESRFILVDTEPKVIQSILIDKSLQKMIGPKNYVISSDGCGNNWSMGYNFDKLKKKEIKDSFMRILKREVEQATGFVQCVLFFHSLSGGTGSGMGSRLLEEMKVKYPMVRIFTISVYPFSNGDNNLRFYNTLLTFNWLNKYADLVFLFKNDELIKKFSRDKLTDMNFYIATCLGHVVLPVKDKKTGKWKGFDSFQWVNDLAMFDDPRLKFLNIQTSTIVRGNRLSKNYSISITHESWKKNYNQFDITNKKVQTLSSVVLFRGKSISDSELKTIGKKIRRVLNQVEWNKESSKVMVSDFQSLPSYNVNLSISSISNSTHVVEILNEILSTSRIMIDSGAYLHWFERYGCSKKDLENCIKNLHKVIIQYCFSAAKNELQFN